MFVVSQWKKLLFFYCHYLVFAALYWGLKYWNYTLPTPAAVATWQSAAYPDLKQLLFFGWVWLCPNTVDTSFSTVLVSTVTECYALPKISLWKPFFKSLHIQASKMPKTFTDFCWIFFRVTASNPEQYAPVFIKRNHRGDHGVQTLTLLWIHKAFFPFTGAVGSVDLC